MTTIASEAEARTALGLMTAITDEERAILNLLLPAAEQRVLDHIGYDPVQRLATEYYPRADPSGGIGQVGGVWDVDSNHRTAQLYGTRGSAPLYPTLQLQRLPVREVTDLRIDYAGKYGQGGGFGNGEGPGDRLLDRDGGEQPGPNRVPLQRKPVAPGARHRAGDLPSRVLAR